MGFDDEIVTMIMFEAILVSCNCSSGDLRSYCQYRFSPHSTESDKLKHKIVDD